MGGLCPRGSLSRGGLYPGSLCKGDPLPLHGKERAVHIILECFLVNVMFIHIIRSQVRHCKHI